MNIREVAVVGLGTMGAGIAEVFARAGIGVVAIEIDPEALARGMNMLDASLTRAVSRGRLSAADRDAILGRVRPAAGFHEAATVDLAIEVVPERMEIKRQIFAELDRVCGPEAVLATNTSSLSVTSIACETRDPDRVIGLHFFNPAPVMRLVEVVSTVLTADGLADGMAALVRHLGKTPVEVADRAGFVANALLLPYLNQAVRLLETGYASREDIDTAATAGIGLPMGPLALLDLIGLDTSLSILEVLDGELGGSRYAPAPLLRRLVSAGRMGRKSGEGIYRYRDVAGSGDGAAGPVPSTVTVISSGRAADAELASAAAAAGVNITRNPAHASDLVVISAAPDEMVLPAAVEAGRPAETIGLHLPPVMSATGNLAEVVSTRLTGPHAAAAGAALASRLGLQAVHAPDRPGFLVGALLYPHLADAIRMVQDGYATVSDVDTAMMLGCGYPLGPFGLLDKVGGQVVLDGLRAMHAGHGDPAYAPPPLLAEHVAASLSFAG